MNNKLTSGLILEGGGMRGIFTIGVLDAFMEAKIRFPYVIGVSAGACNACSYVTEQQGRAYYSNVGMVRKYGHQYLGVRMLLKTGCIFNTKLLYDDLPNKLWLYDYDRFFNTDTEFEMVTTNMNTGQAEYLSNHSPAYQTLTADEAKKRAMDVVLASSSLPYVSKIVNVDGIPMLDGGITDSIPVERAMSLGYTSNVLVLTRNKGYRKNIRKSAVVDWLADKYRSHLYSDYPQFMDALKHRSELYNQQLELVERLEAEGKVMVIRPENPIRVGRIERNTQRLEELYQEGLRIGRKYCKTIMQQR